MPEDMPDRMPDRMSEDMSDRMPEDLPVRKCINVMVGITRSKVIVLVMVLTTFVGHLRQNGRSAHERKINNQTVGMKSDDIYTCPGNPRVEGEERRKVGMLASTWPPHPPTLGLKMV